MKLVHPVIQLSVFARPPFFSPKHTKTSLSFDWLPYQTLPRLLQDHVYV